MIDYIPFFLALTPSDLSVPVEPVQSLNPWFHSVLIVVAAVLTLFCLALSIIWIFKNSSKPEKQPNGSPENGQTKNWLGLKKRHKKYKRRYPTLADVKGLPPKRSESNNNTQTNVQQ
jgi:hypothetical protein